MKKTGLLRIFVLLLLFAVLFGSLSVASARSRDGNLAGEDRSPQGSSEIIEVKFVEGSTYRLQDGALAAQEADALTGITGVIDTFAITHIERLFSQPEEEIETERATLMASSGESLPDLNLWYRIWVPEGQEIDQVIAALNALPEVQTAYAAPLPAPPPSMGFSPQMIEPTPGVIPDYESDQGYLDAAPVGVDAKHAWGLAGGRGQNVQIVDIEYAWNTSHEDLPAASLIHGAQYLGFGDDHGTAVLGELAAKKDSVGVSGIAYQSTVKLSSPCPNSSCTGFNLADAINAARTNTTSGDVILIEQQTPVCGLSDYGPVEWHQANFDAIQVATAAGRIVVQAAGNGGVNLDDENCNDLFDRTNRDSGAIIVGAGAPPNWSQTARSRLGFSSYGSRVDLQGWGGGVYTTGYGDLYTGTGKNQWYTDTFNGTSSASPIVAGAASLLSSVAQERGITLTPLQIRTKLVSTGSAQQAATGYPVSENIGPLPNVKGAINTLPANTVPTPVAPKGTITDTTPTYQWTKVDGATQYKLELYKGTTKVYTLWPSSGVCGSSYCYKTPTTVLSTGNYRWRVQAKVGGVWKAFSDYKWFTLEAAAPGFTSWFGSGAYGWKPIKGTWNITSQGWYQTPGLVGYVSSAAYKDLYTTLTYEVKMKRTADDAWANRLYVRGTPYPLSEDSKSWYSGYTFQYTNDGYYSVWKYVNGVPTMVEGWTTYAGIKPYEWNRLLVTAQGSSMKFYINGGLVWSGTDTSLASGKVGLGMYRDAAGWNPLSVDWAKLTTTVSAAAVDEPFAEGIGETDWDWDNPDVSPGGQP